MKAYFGKTYLRIGIRNSVQGNLRTLYARVFSETPALNKLPGAEDQDPIQRQMAQKRYTEHRWVY